MLASASTVEKDNRTGATGNVVAAGKVGKMIAERAKAVGVESVAFDRSGYAYPVSYTHLTLPTIYSV